MITSDTFSTRPTVQEDVVSLASVCVPSRKDEIELAIAHEINQPLAVIALHTAAARKWLCNSEPNVERALESLAAISEASCHAGEIVRVIKRLAFREDSEFECVSVDQTIHDALRLLQSTLCKHGIKTKLGLNLRHVTVRANRVQLQQVVTNLIVNAVEALSDDQRSLGERYIKVQSRIINGREAEISVEDNGPGIEPKDRDRIFSRHFTTKVGNTGLGLSISLATIRSHHGCIEYEPCDPYGARFRICLPIHMS